MYSEQTPVLSPQTAERLARRVYAASGMVFPKDREEFLQSRLRPRLARLGLQDFAAYAAYLDGTDSEDEQQRLVDALTTNTTSFFRERQHFDWLSDVGLPTLYAKGTGRYTELRIWSAAASTGAEMWSAGMTVESFAEAVGSPLRYGLAGSDISLEVLKRAATALFDAGEISGIPEPLRKKHLLRSHSSDVPVGREIFKIAGALRSKAQLFQANLCALDRSPPIAADIIFLRNVLIYFSHEDQSRVIAAVTKRLRPGGFLLVGHNESLPAVPPDLVRLESSIYAKSDDS